MRVSLLHNPGAGRRDHEEKWLIDRMHAAGHHVSLIGDSHTPGADNSDLIVAAGGDGTVGKAARRFGHLGLPFAILPLGTANNIAYSLGIDDGPEALIRRWPESASDRTGFRQRLALGEVRHGERRRFFIESVGAGLLSRLAPVAKLEKKVRQSAYSDKRATLGRQIDNLQRILADMKADDYRISVDGRDVSGRYLLAEMMNISRAGPALPLAPGQRPDEDLLTAVLVDSSGRGALLDFLEAVSLGREPEDCFTRIQGRHFRLRAPARDIHVDDKHLKRDEVPGEIMDLQFEAGVRYLTILK